MHPTKRAGFGIIAASTLFWSLTGPTFADGYVESTAAPSADQGRKFTWSFTAGATSDYIFRGISQTLNRPAAQGSVDIGYGIFYAGVWGSNVNFGADEDPPLGPKAVAEVDWYAGIKPVWGPITFDFGGIFYSYPNSGRFANFTTPDNHLEYFELKAGYSLASPWIKNLTTGTTFFWSPDYALESGNVFTWESGASYALPKVGIFSPTISGAFGMVSGDSEDGFSVGGTTEDEYNYWNAGLSLGVEKFTFDFRYWDTDIKVVPPGGACAAERLCDAHFAFIAKVTLP